MFEKMLDEGGLLPKKSEEKETEIEVLDAIKRNGRLMFTVKEKNNETIHTVDSTIANVIYTTAVIAFYEKIVKWI